MVPDSPSVSKPRFTSATDPRPEPSRIPAMSTSQEAGARAELPGVYRPGKRAIVVGASSGMGAAVVRQLADEGYSVVALARRSEALTELQQSCQSKPGSVHVEAHDVSDFDAVPALFERWVGELGGLDLFVFAAGVMPEVAEDEYSTEKDHLILKVNLLGCVAWCNPVAKLFETQRGGTLIGVSSIAGDRGRRGNPAYCTSKAAMNTYLEALRNRLAQVGAHVCTIKPGYVDTAMTQGMDGLFWLASPEEAARKILAAGRGGANERYVKRRWWLVGTIIKAIPSFLFKRIGPP